LLLVFVFFPKKSLKKKKKLKSQTSKKENDQTIKIQIKPKGEQVSVILESNLVHNCIPKLQQSKLRASKPNFSHINIHIIFNTRGRQKLGDTYTLTKNTKKKAKNHTTRKLLWSVRLKQTLNPKKRTLEAFSVYLESVSW
jgi:hypothetical protein